MYDEGLLDRAAAVVRATGRDEVLAALRLLHSGITARECSRGGFLLDSDGRPWGERVASLERLVRQARGAGQLADAVATVARELEALTGVGQECGA